MLCSCLWEAHQDNKYEKFIDISKIEYYRDNFNTKLNIKNKENISHYQQKIIKKR